MRIAATVLALTLLTPMAVQAAVSHPAQPVANPSVIDVQHRGGGGGFGGGGFHGGGFGSFHGPNGGFAFRGPNGGVAFRGPNGFAFRGGPGCCWGPRFAFGFGGGYPYPYYPYPYYPYPYPYYGY
jgi:hypothetical protein